MNASPQGFAHRLPGRLAPALVAIALLSALYIGVGLHWINDEFDSRGSAMAGELLPVEIRALDEGDPQRLSEIADRMLAHRGIVAVELLSPGGTPLLSRRHADALTHTLTRSVILPLELQGRPAGSLILVFDTSDYRDAREQVLLQGAGGAALAVFVAWLLAFFIPDERHGAVAEDPPLRSPPRPSAQSTPAAGNDDPSAALLQLDTPALPGQVREILGSIESQYLELERAHNRVVESCRIKGDFMANVSHEVRTPMNAIIGFGNLLSHTPLDDEQRAWLDTVRSSASALLAIFNDILDFVLLEQNEIRINRIRFDLRQVVEDALRIYAPQVYDKGLTLILLYYRDVPREITGDPVRVRQVIMNLVSNAVKSTLRGEIAVRVMVEEEGDDSLIRIDIQDTGIGLSEQDRKAILDAVERGDTAILRGFGGVGLGLIISNHLARAMGGRIGLDSELGKGTRCWFSFRVDAERQCDSPEEVARHRGRCLLYDRHDLSRLSIRHLLEQEGLEVLEASHGGALEAPLTEGESLDLIVLSLDRRELVSSLAAELIEMVGSLAPHTPSLALVDSVDSSVLDSVRRLGTSTCLGKPLRMREMEATLATLLGESPTLEEEGGIPGPDLSGIHVLVVDDNDINRKLALSLLRKQGADVTPAANGVEALRLAASRYFDLILMDIQMPVLDGIETTARLRAMEHGGRRTPIVAVTANALYGERERLIRAGLDDYLVKPIEEESLWAMVSRWLGRPVTLATEQFPRGGASRPPSVHHHHSPAEKGVQRRAIELCGGNAELAEELLEMLVRELPEMQRSIHLAWRSGSIENLESAAHRLHGAAACCAVLPLKEAAGALEKAAIRRWVEEIPERMEELTAQIERFLATHSTPC
ncbi:MAG TPA: response regulator [Thiotrichales bacterium]|nr:response regulator [Thiotrichales bacterium]